MPFIDYYKVLGVSPYATQDEIKAAFRKLSKQYHPDLHGGDTNYAEKFMAVKTAYDALGDVHTRSVYQRYYEAYYQPKPHPHLYQQPSNTAYAAPQKIKLDTRTLIIILIPLILFIAAIVSSENSIKDSDAQRLTGLRQSKESVDTISFSESEKMSAFMQKLSTATFRITLYSYSNRDSAYSTFRRLNKLKSGVGLLEYSDSLFTIDMPFKRPLSDTTIVKDSLDKLFDTECTVGY